MLPFAMMVEPAAYQRFVNLPQCLPGPPILPGASADAITNQARLK
jgi:hypothetical protein